MIKKISFLALVSSLLLLSACSITNKTTSTINPTVSLKDSVLYYSVTCPHCQLVEQYINDNKVLDKFPMTLKEVSQSKEAATELISKAELCGVAQKDLGVPFLVADGKCLVGDTDIIDFLKTKTGASK